MKQRFKLQLVTAICFSLAISPFFVLAATPSKDFTNRQQSFHKVMELSNAEIQNLNKSLDDLQLDGNSEYAQEKTKLSEILSGFDAYNKEVSEKISKAKSVASLKTLAVEYKNWRENTYNLQAQIIINFSLLVQQRAMLDTANDRLNKVQKDVEKLGNLGVDQITQLNLLLDKSRQNLGDANQSFEKAKTIIDDYFSATSTPATTTEEIATSTANASSTIDVEINEGQVDASQLQLLLEDGFTKIKSAYEAFIEMSAVVKKL
ncbi:MAG: hypothetical protein WC297_00185 [Candidatus Paceibacterota bacterium]|jgi:hypothetical protein